MYIYIHTYMYIYIYIYIYVRQCLHPALLLLLRMCQGTLMRSSLGAATSSCRCLTCLIHLISPVDSISATYLQSLASSALWPATTEESAKHLLERQNKRDRRLSDIVPHISAVRGTSSYPRAGPHLRRSAPSSQAFSTADVL